MKAAGGSCFWGCEGPTIREIQVGECNGSVNHVYKMWKCKKCGEEFYEKDGHSISPSEFFKAIYRVDVYNP